jgi:hypothetical protein
MEERIVTPLGPVLITLSGDDEGVRIEQGEASRTMRDGTPVDTSLVEIVFVHPVKELTVTLSFDGEGGPESGENLECITFDLAGGRLSIATRDSEWLTQRGFQTDWASYGASSLRLDLQHTLPNARLPIALAWRLGSPSSWPSDDIATWFAVDLALPN